METKTEITLTALLKTLNVLAPLSLAESWDNVGLLVEPYFPKTPSIKSILLSNDFDNDVLEEAIELTHKEPKEAKVLLVVYHPVIFQAIKKVSYGNGRSNTSLIAKALTYGIPIYCPHTALDSCEGGINDWLCSGLGSGKVDPIQIHESLGSNETIKIVVFCPVDSTDKIREAMSQAGAGIIGNYDHCSYNLEGFGTFIGNERSNPTVGEKLKFERVKEIRLEMVCSKSSLSKVVSALKKTHPYEEPSWELYQLHAKPQLGVGQGRVLILDQKVKLSEIIERVKKHLQLDNVRVATPRHAPAEQVEIGSIAVCAGSGYSVIKSSSADLLLTGEARHHDSLEAIKAGKSLILCEHSNTERGYLEVFKQKLLTSLGPNATSLQIFISKTDKDPLKIY